MDLSVIPLDSEGKMWQWLISTDLSEIDRKNKSKSEYRAGFIKTHLQRSIKDLFHILPRSSKLKKEAIYDTLNALTLKTIIHNLLLNVEQKSEHKREKYDFRTVELARMLFLVSTSYLMKSPIWVGKKYVETDVERVSHYFEALADGFLDKESHVTIKELQERKILEELDKVRNKFDNQKFDEKRNQLINEKNEMENQKSELQNLINVAQSQNNTQELTQLEKKFKKINDSIQILRKKIHDVTEKRETSYKEIKKEKNALLEKLDHKYDHLLNVFCPIDRLDPFKDKKSPHLPDDHPENEYLN